MTDCSFNTDVKVSVLMPVLNGMPYVIEAIESILAQTFVDFELLIIDNGSDDGTVECLTEYERNDPRIRIVSLPAPRGYGFGVNKGASLAKGKWLAFIDADDVALPTRLESQIKWIESNPKIGAASCLAYYISDKGKILGKTFHDLKTEKDFFKYLDSNEMIAIFNPGAIVRRDLFLSLGGHRPQFEAAHDVDFWNRLSETGFVILVQQEYLMKYRVHPNQISNKFIHTRIKYYWLRQCVHARRKKLNEPSWEEFLVEYNSVSLVSKVNRARKTYSKYFYRKAGLHFVCSKEIHAAFFLSCSFILQPIYVIKRLRRQLL